MKKSFFIIRRIGNILRDAADTLKDNIRLLTSYGNQEIDFESDRKVMGGYDTASEDTVELEIACVGDIMVHISQVTAALQDDGTYSFAENYAYVKPYIEKADLAICNVETTFGGAPYTGYPGFCSPDELAYDIKAAGFDIVSTANNHMMDKGGEGLLRTIDVLSDAGLKVTGSVSDPSLPKYAMANIKGVNVAVIAYTYRTPLDGGVITINGIKVPDECAVRINSFGYQSLDDDLAKVRNTVAEAKAAGADIVILYYHWGDEYVFSANDRQYEVAQKTADTMDVDVIFGSHPHNLQETTYIGDVPVFFSLGNFISGMRRDTKKSAKFKHCEIGAIGKVSIEYDKASGKIVSTQMSAVPTWVDKYSDENDKIKFVIIPLDKGFEDNEILAYSGHLNRAKVARHYAADLLGFD